MKIVFISDTHWKFGDIDQIPEGDVLVHCGDLETRKLSSLARFNEWIDKHPFKHKLVIAGNHDGFIEENPTLARDMMSDFTYLENSEYVIDGVKFYGSPMTPIFLDWHFMATPDRLKRYWDAIPNNTDILITHGPPWGIMDMAADGTRCGCENLLRRVTQVKPKIHAFGHIHEGYGIKDLYGIKFINCSLLDADYKLVNKPIVIDYE